jgi:hypothetical protein
LIEFNTGSDLFEGIFMVSPQLANDAIIGCQFLREYGVGIDFKKSSFCYAKNGEPREHLFHQKSGPQEETGDDTVLEDNRPHITPPLRPGLLPHSSYPTLPTPHKPSTVGCVPHPPSAVYANNRRKKSKASEFEDVAASSEFNMYEGNDSLLPGTSGDLTFNDGGRDIVEVESAIAASPRGGYINNNDDAANEMFV